MTSRFAAPVTSTLEQPLSSVVYAIDEGYVEPMAASLQSLIDTWIGPAPTVTVLDCGLEAESRHALFRSFTTIDLHIQTVEVARLVHLPMLKHFGAPASFARLLMHEYLDPSWTRALYLDADTLVLRSLADFQVLPLLGSPVAAAPEMYSPTISNSHAFPHFRRFQISPHQLYFNSGVLIIDLDQWRAQRCGERTLQFIGQHRELLRYPDQDALNVVLGSEVTPLDPSWNCGWMWDDPSFNGYEWYGDVAKRALIRHFMGEEKPWHDNFGNIDMRDLYRRALHKSEFNTP